MPSPFSRDTGKHHHAFTGVRCQGHIHHLPLCPLQFRFVWFSETRVLYIRRAKYEGGTWLGMKTLICTLVCSIMGLKRWSKCSSCSSYCLCGQGSLSQQPGSDGAEILGKRPKRRLCEVFIDAGGSTLHMRLVNLQRRSSPRPVPAAVKSPLFMSKSHTVNATLHGLVQTNGL